MYLASEIKNILSSNKISDENLKDLTREELRNLNLTNQQINEIIIYLQLKGLDIKKRK